MSDEKVYTLKSVKSEIVRLEKSRDKKKEKIKALTEELKVDNARMKELENIFDQLYHENLQKQIAEVWFKEEKLTGEQITKFLELSKHICDKIDILDVQTVANAVTDVYNKQNEVKEIKETSTQIAIVKS